MVPYPPPPRWKRRGLAILACGLRDRRPPAMRGTRRGLASGCPSSPLSSNGGVRPGVAFPPLAAWLTARATGRTRSRRPSLSRLSSDRVAAGEAVRRASSGSARSYSSTAASSCSRPSRSDSSSRFRPAMSSALAGSASSVGWRSATHLLEAFEAGPHVADQRCGLVGVHASDSIELGRAGGRLGAAGLGAGLLLAFAAAGLIHLGIKRTEEPTNP